MLRKIMLITVILISLFSTSVVAMTVQLLPNTTHNKAYQSDVDQTISNPSIATTEYSDAEYGQANTSNNVYHHITATGQKVASKYTYERFTFNLSSYIASMTWIQYCYEGYYYTDDVGSDKFYYRNMTSGAWVLNATLTTSDATYCTNWTNASFTPLYNATSGMMELGTQCQGGIGYSSSDCYTDFVNTTLSYTPATTNTCTYGGSGDWLININDNCTLSSANTVTGNIYIYGSNGYLNFGANQLAHAFYYNVSSLGTWYYNNFRWLY